MSGGSYDYLFTKDWPDLPREALERMADRLDEVAPGHPATARTRQVLEDLRAFHRLDPISDLREVWKAVEWVDSHDSNLPAITAALAKYAPR